MASSGKDEGQDLLKTLSSLQFGIVLLIAIAVIAIIGTLIPQNQPPEFYYEHFGALVNSMVSLFRFDIIFRSPLFIGLLLLFALNLILCSIIRFPGLLKRTFAPDLTPAKDHIAVMPVHEMVKTASLEEVAGAFGRTGMRLRSTGERRLYGEKGRLGYLGSSLVHLSLLLFIVGGMVSLMTSIRGYVLLEPGQSASEAILADGSTIPLGFTLELDRFEVSFYDEYPGRPKSYVSYVNITGPGMEPRYTDIRVNHPFERNGFTVYQSSYGPIDQTVESMPGDLAVVAVNLKGMPEEMPPITTFELTVGETVAVPGLGDSITVTLSELHRDFQRIRGLTSGANPAVLLDVKVQDETRWNVYAFQNFPGMNMPMSDDLPLLFTLEEIKGNADTTMMGGQPGGYYTVLGVSLDSGIPVMWLASAFMVAGFICSFYIRPRRIWVIEDDGNVLIGAQTKGDTTSLREYVRGVLKSMRSA